MAVLSRPSRRSSRRKEEDHEVAPTEKSKPRQPSESRKSKRGRISSIGHDSDTSSKKLKTHPSSGLIKPVRQKRDALKTLPFRARQPIRKDIAIQDVKSKKLDPVLVQPKNGFVISSSDTEDSPHHGINQNLPPPSRTDVEKRTLRSQDGGSRAKSELAPYFSNYDDLISIGPKDTDVLAPKSMLYIVDDPSSSATNGTKQQGGKAQTLKPCMEWPDELFATLHDSTRLDLASLSSRLERPKQDPLDDSVYLKAHAREERKEKQLRNIEKERAMHEKVQLERLLDGLKGHDWLRVMGISGITDTEKKAYEPKRDNLIRLVKALLEKFRLWKEEEKRRKAEKEEELEDEDDDDQSEEDSEESEGDASTSENADHSSDVSDGDPPDYNDADISAARQLQAEALNVKRFKMTDESATASQDQVAVPLKKIEPIKSFYSKAYLRAATIGNHRRSGRTRMAFGQALPEVVERDFNLPGDIRTMEAMLESGRRMRQSKRDVKDPG